MGDGLLSVFRPDTTLDLADLDNRVPRGVECSTFAVVVFDVLVVVDGAIDVSTGRTVTSTRPPT